MTLTTSIAFTVPGPAGSTHVDAAEVTARDGLARATGHLWDWKAAAETAEEALAHLEGTQRQGMGDPPAASASLGAEARNVAAGAAWQGGDPQRAARLLDEALAGSTKP